MQNRNQQLCLVLIYRRWSLWLRCPWFTEVVAVLHFCGLWRFLWNLWFTLAFQLFNCKLAANIFSLIKIWFRWRRLYFNGVKMFHNQDEWLEHFIQFYISAILNKVWESMLPEFCHSVWDKFDLAGKIDIFWCIITSILNRWIRQHRQDNETKIERKGPS